MSDRSDSVNVWELDEAAFPRQGTAREKLEFLCRYAIMAPFSHNTQPWKFSIMDDSIRVYADTTRWLRVADADRRELFISTGCAIENLLISAQHFGYSIQAEFFSDHKEPTCVLSGKLASISDSTEDSSLFEAIPRRSTNRALFDSKPVPQSILQQLNECVQSDDIFLYLITDQSMKRSISRLMEQADHSQFAQPVFRDELAYWIGKGGFGSSALMSRIGGFAVRHFDMGKALAKKDIKLLMSAPVFGLLCSKDNDRLTQVRTGRIFERLWLKATNLGLGLQPLSQLCQVPDVKAKLKKMLCAQELHPQQPFRLGYARSEKLKKRSTRRDIHEFFI